jgi:hypothetical protein
MRNLLLVERLDLRPSNHYILVSESPSCLRLAKMCVCQVRRRSRWSPRYLTWFSWGICTSFIWTDGHVSRLVVNVTWTVLVSLALIRQSLSQDWVARRAVCSLWEAVAGSLSAATTAVSSAKVAVKGSGEVGRSASCTSITWISSQSRQLEWVRWPPACEGVNPRA